MSDTTLDTLRADYRAAFAQYNADPFGPVNLGVMLKKLKLIQVAEQYGLDAAMLFKLSLD